MTINLELFCSGPDRPELAQPWSIGEWSYSSNGHICVRVPRREDIPENEDAPKKAPDLFSKARTRFRPAPSLLREDAKVEVTTTEECFECAGTGLAHPDCDSCRHTCPDCDGEGNFTMTTYPPVKIGKIKFCAMYLKWMLALPDLEIGPARRMTRSASASPAARGC